MPELPDRIQYARRFNAHLPAIGTVHGVVFPAGRIVADNPIGGLIAFASVEAMVSGDSDVTVYWADEEYTPPPPGSDRDKLPDHLLRSITEHSDVWPYVSTYCQTAQALEEAATRDYDLADELREWSDRQHRSCRLTRKQDMAPCLCGCGHPGREKPAATDSEEATR